MVGELDMTLSYTIYPPFEMPTVAASSIKICLFHMYHIASSPLLCLCFVSKLILLLLFPHTACPVLKTYRFSQGVTSDFLVTGLLEEFFGFDVFHCVIVSWVVGNFGK